MDANGYAIAHLLHDAHFFLTLVTGLYPVTGQTTYLLTSPFLPALDIRLSSSPDGTGNSGPPNVLKIRARNLSTASFYVQVRILLSHEYNIIDIIPQRVTLNGESWTKSWIEHKDIASGGLLEFELGETPVSWDTGSLPPSVSTGGFK